MMDMAPFFSIGKLHFREKKQGSREVIKDRILVTAKRPKRPHRPQATTTQETRRGSPPKTGTSGIPHWTLEDGLSPISEIEHIERVVEQVNGAITMAKE